MNGNMSGNLSEHAHSNAVDVSAFVLADGRRITVKNDWHGDDRTRRFLQVVHDSACKRFRTVLSPDYNAAHHDHFHFDMGGKGTYCRRSEEHTSELQSLMRRSYAVFCLKKKKTY